MTNIIDEIKKKQEEIRKLREKAAHQKGQEKQLLKQLKDETEVDTVEESEKKLEELGQELIENEKFLKKLDEEMAKIISTATAGIDSDTE